jgi:hypothetical protein
MRRSVRHDGDPVAGFARIFAPLAPHIAPADYFIANLESPIATIRRHDNDAFAHQKVGRVRVRAPLNAPAWLASGLRAAGVDAVMLANNHALDQEREGLAETIATVRAADLAVTGAGRAPHVAWPLVIGSEPSITVLSFFEKDFPEPALPPGEAGLSVLGPGSVDTVRQAAQHSAGVVVIVHVVAELFGGIKPQWRAWARTLVEAGADAIVLHGTHVPGPVERLHLGDRTAVIAYGLGNLVSDMGARATPSRPEARHEGAATVSKWGLAETREALIARITLVDGSVDVSFLPGWMSTTRWLVHNFVRAPPIEFALRPLAACGPAVALPSDWPEPWRAEATTWIGERRDHLLARTRLASPGACTAGTVEMLRP